MRAKKQTTGYGRPLGPTNPKPMTAAARKLLARSRGSVAPLPKKPPHAHRYVDGACSVCALPEIEST